jgi:translation initiation factor 2 beta subunit (eIF-2beta)/eIF-5
MDAVRCLECGATRWALARESFERLLSEPCQVCGGKTVAERRHPGTGAARPLVERRDLEEHSTR